MKMQIRKNWIQRLIFGVANLRVYGSDMNCNPSCAAVRAIDRAIVKFVLKESRRFRKK